MTTLSSAMGHLMLLENVFKRIDMNIRIKLSLLIHAEILAHQLYSQLAVAKCAAYPLCGFSQIGLGDVGLQIDQCLVPVGFILADPFFLNTVFLHDGRVDIRAVGKLALPVKYSRGKGETGGFTAFAAVGFG